MRRFSLGLFKSCGFGKDRSMDRLFATNVEDKEVLFKKTDNPEGVVQNVSKGVENTQYLSQKSTE